MFLLRFNNLAACIFHYLTTKEPDTFVNKANGSPKPTK